MPRLLANRWVAGLAALALALAFTHPVAAQTVTYSGPGSGPSGAGPAVVLCQSAVAVAHTGDTNETALATCTIPANAMGPNGAVSISALWSNNNSGNNKTARVRYSTISGTTHVQTTQTTNLSNRWVNSRISNRNATNSQVGFVGGNALFAASAIVTSAVDTTVVTTVVLTGQLANSGDTITLESYVIELVWGN